MKVLSYDAFKDELVLRLSPIRRKPNKEVGPFKLWWDKKGNIRAVAITSYTKELEEFRKRLDTVRLGGIWKGITIADEDMRESREELLRRLEEKW